MATADFEFAVTEHPIPFSPEMVLAILKGRKTQTRRVIAEQPAPSDVAPHCENGWWMWRRWTPEHRRHEVNSVRLGDRRCPYGVPGDRLWVRERHCYLDVTRRSYREMGNTIYDLVVEYSDGTERDKRVDNVKPKQTRERGEVKWRPAMFMHRWASRINLEVTEVRVQRLQDISEADAVAEGCFALGDSECTACRQYETLWDSLNAERGYGWNTNPWVWAVTFKRIR